MMDRETIDEILRKAYIRLIIPDHETGTYTGEILEFQGCRAQGGTPEETYARLEDVARDWVRVAIDARQAIPAPFSGNGYSGKVALRLPKSLHKQCARLAAREGVSLNQFFLGAIAERVGAVKAMGRAVRILSTVVHSWGSAPRSIDLNWDVAIKASDSNTTQLLTN